MQDEARRSWWKLEQKLELELTALELDRETMVAGAAQ